MKTKVSKFSFLLSGLTLTIIMCMFFFSCQKEENVSMNELFDYEQIGIEHNKGLDYVFDYLKKEELGGRLSLKRINNVFDLTKQATISFAKTSDITKDIDFDKLPLIFQPFNQNKVKSAGTDKLTSSIETEIELSQLQVLFLNRLDEVMSNLEIGLQPTIEKIKDIELDIKEQCSNEESELLLAATVVGRYSLEYWLNNYEKWISELSGGDITIKATILKSANATEDWDWFWDTLGNMGKSDVVGGAIGAGVGALAGGVGAIPGAVAGACYSSAGRGIVALYDHWKE